MPNETVHSGTKIALSNANEADNSSSNQQDKQRQTPEKMESSKTYHEKQQSRQNSQQEMKREMPNGTIHMGTKEPHRTLPTKSRLKKQQKKEKKTTAIPRDDDKQSTLGEITAPADLNTEREEEEEKRLTEQYTWTPRSRLQQKQQTEKSGKPPNNRKTAE